MPEAASRRFPGTGRRRLAVLGLAVLAAAAWWWSRRSVVHGTRPSVAVLRFEDRSELPNTAWLSAALSETLSSALSTGGELRLIPGETVARRRQELALGETDVLPSTTLEQIGKSLNTDFVVVGSYQVSTVAGERQLGLELHLQDTWRGSTLASTRESGSEEDLFPLVTGAASALRVALGAGRISFADVRSTMPSSLSAFRLYLDGLERLRGFDALAACDSLEQAVGHDPDFALAHALLSRAWSTLGYDQQAKDSARRAFELADGLPTEEVLGIEARYHEAAAEWQKAIDAHRELWRRFPDSVDYGLRLATAQVAAGRGREALATVEALHRLAGPAGEDPRIDLVEAAAAKSLSDHRAQLAAAEAAARRGRNLGATLLVADALRLQGEVFYRLLDMAKANAALIEARRLFTEAGDRAKAAQVLIRIAELRYYEEDTAGAEALYLEALAIHQGIGHRKEVARTLNSLGDLLRSRGNLASARTMLEEAVAVGRELGDRVSEADYLDTLVEILIRQGDVRAARELAQEELALYQGAGNREWTAWSYFNLGRATLAAGEVTRARELLEQALEIGDDLDNSYLIASVLDVLARALLAHRDLPGARRMSEDSRAIRLQLGGQATLAGSRMTAAMILSELGHPSEAETLARFAAEAFKKQGMFDEEAAAVTQVARALLEQGRLLESDKALAGARARAADSQNPSVRLSVAITHAHHLAAIGRSADALRELEKAVAEAADSGLMLLELEARLAQGRLEVEAANPSIAAAGRDRLEALATRARDLGCRLIAAKATAAAAAAGTRSPQTLPGDRVAEVW